MSTYRIELRFQDPYISNKYGGDRVLFDNLTLEEAQDKLLELYNENFDGEREFAESWDAAVIQSVKHIFGANETNPDGTRSFDWDSRLFVIVAE